MLLRLFLLFTLVPIAELALLIRIGGAIGLGWTLVLVAATGAAGAWLARREGLRSWLAVQGELATGRVPGEELGHGVLILIAGIVLLTPGVITDVMGISLLLRPVRRALIARFRKNFERQLEQGTAGFMGGPGVGVFWSGTAGPPGGTTGHPGETLFDAIERGSADRGTGRSAGYPGGREIVVDDTETPQG
jgi:UPF0716 protein FxsA